MQDAERKLVTIIRNVITMKVVYPLLTRSNDQPPFHLAHSKKKKNMQRSYKTGISSVRYQPFNTNPQYYEVLKNTLAQKEVKWTVKYTMTLHL